MKLGILSDSHGQVRRVRRAMTLLEHGGAEAYIHCGDVGNLDVLDELAGQQCWFVWGNMDIPEPTWRPHLEAINLSWPNGPLQLTLAGKRIAVFHGHERKFRRAVASGKYDYVFYGHTHRYGDHRVGPTRVINPGALYRVNVYTVALLDLANEQIDFIDIDDKSPHGDVKM